MAVDLTPVYEALRKADAAGDTDGAQKLAAYIKAQSAPQGRSFDLVNGQPVPTGSPEARAAQSPVSDSALENFRTATGKGLVDLGRGAGQMLGLESRQNVVDARARDAPLMNTTAGKAGDLFGTTAGLLPAALIPGAGTLAGASAIGAASGLLQPSASTGETLTNIGAGGALGPTGILAGRGLGALYQGGKAALEPFFQGGQQRIAGRVLQSFAGTPQEAAAAAQRIQTPPAMLSGIQPTTAELADNAGLSQLERTVANNPQYKQTVAARNQANQSTVANAIRGIGGTDAQMASAQQARSAASQPLYQSARAATVPADADLGKLLARPSLKAAWSRAADLAAERGETLSGENANDITGGTLQYLKMALQDTANAGPQRGMGAHELNAVRSTLGDLQGWITKNVPSLRAADSAYASGSAPINQMQIGRDLSNRLLPALSDFSAAPSRLNAASFANAVRNGDQLAADATGNARATLAGTLSPDQMGTINLAGEHLARRAAVNDSKAFGSNTAENLIGQNLLSQFLGPLGLPQSTLGRAAASTIGRSITRPYQWAAGAAEPDVMRELARASLDPQYAHQLLTQHPNSRVAQLLWARQGLLGPASTSAGLGLMGSGNAAKQ